MIGPYDVTLWGRSSKHLYFITKDGKKRALKDNLSKKELAMELGIGSEDAKVFREETWFLAYDMPIVNEEFVLEKFWKS
jgi:hypothetical protein|uniref:Uncharacterized protein n=1 Tax=uncultured Caudovirales phage TaxID=2100421 RepID=A0A6J5L1T2_9CAUD|nr:hypothetical protein UFOVP88_28 [uncultured Caudovirales phage]